MSLNYLIKMSKYSNIYYGIEAFSPLTIGKFIGNNNLDKELFKL